MSPKVVFCDFFGEIKSVHQTFLEVKQNPKAGPETPTSWVINIFWRNIFLGEIVFLDLIFLKFKILGDLKFLERLITLRDLQILGELHF